MRFLPLLLLAWPLAEIAGFVVVGREIGVLATVALIILTGIAGSILLRVQGFGVLQRIQAEIDAGRDPGRQLANGAMIVFAGILLILPGFLTDIVGLLLFLPPVRDLLWRAIGKHLSVVTSFGGRRRPADPRTIDLDADDYSVGDPDSPWRRVDKDDRS